VISAVTVQFSEHTLALYHDANTDLVKNMSKPTVCINIHSMVIGHRCTIVTSAVFKYCSTVQVFHILSCKEIRRKKKKLYMQKHIYIIYLFFLYL